MSKKKSQTEEELPKEPQLDSPAHIIITYTEGLSNTTWHEIKSNYTTEQLRDMYNTAVKKYRLNNKNS